MLVLYFSIKKTHVQDQLKNSLITQKEQSSEVLESSDKSEKKLVKEEFENTSSLKEIRVQVLNDSKKISENGFSKSYHKIHTVEFNEVGEKVSLNLVIDESDFNFKNVVLLSKSGDVFPLKFSIDEKKEKKIEEGDNLFKDDWINLSSDGESFESIQLVLKNFAKNSSVDVYVQKFKKAGL